MTVRGRAVTVIVQRDGVLKAATYRIPLWILRAALLLAVILAVVLGLGVAFYAPIVRQASRVPGLESERRRLVADNARIRSLAAALDSVEANYARLRQMVGAEITPDPVARGASLPVAPPILVVPASQRLQYETVPSTPRHWPLDEPGYVTRGQVSADSTDETHPGIDIAVPVGTVVRAAGGGTVARAGSDAEYGLFVLMTHPDGYQTMYGHLSRAIAVEGHPVRAGEALGRSGNTGRSSAPHLHFELRRNGVVVDPLTLIREGR
jgi:murein DD-endopeptidase MepM/ murein hydrolase activator NlpD